MANKICKHTHPHVPLAGMDRMFSAIIYTYCIVQKHDEMIRYMFKT